MLILAKTQDLFNKKLPPKSKHNRGSVSVLTVGLFAEVLWDKHTISFPLLIPKQVAVNPFYVRCGLFGGDSLKEISHQQVAID